MGFSNLFGKKIWFFRRGRWPRFTATCMCESVFEMLMLLVRMWGMKKINNLDLAQHIMIHESNFVEPSYSHSRSNVVVTQNFDIFAWFRLTKQPDHFLSKSAMVKLLRKEKTLIIASVFQSYATFCRYKTTIFISWLYQTSRVWALFLVTHGRFFTVSLIFVILLCQSTLWNVIWSKTSSLSQELQGCSQQQCAPYTLLQELLYRLDHLSFSSNRFRVIS